MDPKNGKKKKQYPVVLIPPHFQYLTCGVMPFELLVISSTGEAKEICKK